MKKTGALSILFVFICFFLYDFTISYAKIYIDIDSPSFRRFPAAVNYFKNIEGGDNQENISEEIHQVLTQDLEISGLFSLLEQPLLSESMGGVTLYKDGKINFIGLSIIGAEVFVEGNFRCNDDDLEIEARLYDVFQGKFVIGKKYIGKRRNLRKMIHRFSDDVLLHFTGERGVFDTKIAFISDESGHKEIYIMDFDGFNVERITDHRSIVLSPSWSPDGKKIVFTSYKNGNPDIYIKDLITNREERIAHYKGLNIAPDWSPDGEWLVVTLSKDGNPEIYRIEMNKKKLRRLTNNWGIDVSPTFSPDGEEVAFVSNRSGNPNIYVIHSSGNNVRRLTFNTKYSVSPDWSPRGDRIVFSSLERGCFNIYTMSSDGTDLKQLTSDSGDNEDPTWSPSGRLIVFTSTRDGRKSIYIMRADGTGQKKLKKFNGKQYGPSWSPRFR
ncbi:MAG: Tol-Pal system beta propeller repeat protein TolB [Thermodesulfobacteriota bacterium]|nr:Tol-Pal system beta propeller repeat protein TolB [Thermodesulfobacteriota bacterium]